MNGMSQNKVSFSAYPQRFLSKKKTSHFWDITHTCDGGMYVERIWPQSKPLLQQKHQGSQPAKIITRCRHIELRHSPFSLSGIGCGNIDRIILITILQIAVMNEGCECALKFQGASTVAWWSATKDANPEGYSADLFNDGPPLLKTNQTSIYGFVTWALWLELQTSPPHDKPLTHGHIQHHRYIDLPSSHHHRL